MHFESPLGWIDFLVMCVLCHNVLAVETGVSCNKIQRPEAGIKFTMTCDPMATLPKLMLNISVSNGEVWHLRRRWSLTLLYNTVITGLEKNGN